MTAVTRISNTRTLVSAETQGKKSGGFRRVFWWRKLYKLLFYLLTMQQETVTIPRQEYEALKKKAEVDEELLQDIARGIKDILEGKVEEV